MRMLNVATLTLAFAFSASTAHAEIGLSWTGCVPSEFEIEPYAAGDHVLTVSLGGYEGEFNSVDFTLAIYDRCTQDGRFLPAAWRFDPGGCQAGALRVERPASFNGCPGLVPATLRSESVSAAMLKETVGPEYIVIEYPAVLVRVMSVFPLTHLSASNRYIVARVHFDMTNTVADVDPAGKACGCASSPREIALLSGRLGTPDGEFPVYPPTSAFWNGYAGCVIGAKLPRTQSPASADPACLTTGSVGTSWGRIKAQYR